MTRFQTRRLIATPAFCALLSLALPAAALAQGGQAATSGGQAATSGAHVAPTPAAPSGSMTSPMPKAMKAQVEQHIRQLHDDLHITASEEGQWDQFADVMRDNAARISQAFQQRGSRLTTMSAEDNMQSYAELAQAHATDMQRLASAFQSLYSSFPAQQKQSADSLFQNSTGKGPIPRKH